jgi:hypothetical protein
MPFSSGILPRGKHGTWPQRGATDTYSERTLPVMTLGEEV